jgi:hypothetical protein
MTKSKGSVYALIEQMTNWYWVIFIAAAIFGCTSNTILKKPDDLISKEQMVDLLTEMYIAVSAENIININDKRNINYFQLIYDKYQIDSAQFKRSSFYYSSKIDEYDNILEQVEKNIKDLNTKYSVQIAKIDSINRVKKDSLREIRKDSLKKPPKNRIKMRSKTIPQTSSKVK